MDPYYIVTQLHETIIAIIIERERKCIFQLPPAFSDLSIQKPFRLHIPGAHIPRWSLISFVLWPPTFFHSVQSHSITTQLVQIIQLSATHVPRRPFLNGLVLFDQFCAVAKLRRALHYCQVDVGELSWGFSSATIKTENKSKIFQRSGNMLEQCWLAK